MKTLALTFLLSLTIQFEASAKALLLGLDDMIKQADVIAIVRIQQLTSTDLTSEQVDLIAKAQIIRTYRGHLQGNIEFRIPRFFPCAPFDVSTGSHMVFLKTVEGKLQGVNWNRSYIHLSAPKVYWFDSDGAFKCDYSAEAVMEGVEKRLKQSSKAIEPRR